MANRGEYTQVIELEADAFVSGAEQASQAADKLAQSINGASQGAANLSACSPRAGGSVEVFKQEADAVAKVNQETRGLMDSRRGLMALGSGLRSAANVASTTGNEGVAAGLNIAAIGASTASLTKSLGVTGLVIGGIELLSSVIMSTVTKIKAQEKAAKDLASSYTDMAISANEAIDAIKDLKTADQVTAYVKKLRDEIERLNQAMQRPGFKQADAGPMRQLIKYYEEIATAAEKAGKEEQLRALATSRFASGASARDVISETEQKLGFQEAIAAAPDVASKTKLITDEIVRLNAVAEKAAEALRFAETEEQIKNFSAVYIQAAVAASQLRQQNALLANSFVDVRTQRQQQIKETEKETQSRIDQMNFNRKLEESTPQEQKSILSGRIAQIEKELGTIDLKGAASRVEPGVFEAELKKYQELTAEMFDLMEKRSSIENKNPRQGEDIFGVFTSNLTRVGGGGRGGLILLPEKMEELISVAKAMDIKLGEIRTQSAEEPVYG